ncbi:MAG: cytochrome c oxidase subunit II [Blastocatellia bacterium]
MGKALAISLWALVAGVVLLFLAHGIWGAAATWWLPPVISAHGHGYDAEFNRTLIVVAVAFVLAQCGLGYMVFRFRAAKRASARYIQGSTRLEAAWTLITLIAFGALAILGEQLWFRYNQNVPPSASGRVDAVNAIDVEVTAKQFAWNFRYPGADGLFGRIDPNQIDDAGGNPVGIDDKDPAGKDDIVTAALSLQVNRPVHLIFRSQDMIHSFFVPGLRFKQDLVPGMEINGYFTPTATGRYEIACAELCGLGHYKMKAYMDVLSEQDFSAWLNGGSSGRPPVVK